MQNPPTYSLNNANLLLMASRSSKIIVLAVLLCLLGLTCGTASSKTDPRVPLRYPFGLAPSTPLPEVVKILESKGLKLLSEKDITETHFVYWQMSGQIVYEDFAPKDAVATFDQGKLSSFSLGVAGISGCKAAQ